MVTNRKTFNDPDYYQPVVIWAKPTKVGFHTETVPYQFISPNVFIDEGDAAKFLIQFVKGLLATGDLPPEVLDKNGQLNERVIKTAIYPVIITEMELDAD